MKYCQCVFPTAAEEELATVPGSEPGSAWRLFVDASVDGYVRIQQLAWVEGIGWYVQKSMVLPREVVSTLIPQLRKAMCLMPPQRSAAAERAIPFLRIVSEDDKPLGRVGS